MTRKNIPTVEVSDDERLAANVRTFVTSRIQPAASHVLVTADCGTVTLSGRVGSFYHKQLWLSGTQRVAGVRRVIDNLHVGRA